MSTKLFRAGLAGALAVGVIWAIAVSCGSIVRTDGGPIVGSIFSTASAAPTTASVAATSSPPPQFYVPPLPTSFDWVSWAIWGVTLIVTNLVAWFKGKSKGVAIVTAAVKENGGKLPVLPFGG